MPPNSGLHFVPIPFSKTFADYYTLGELTHKLREPPRHPKWRDVNLAASVPGWARWSVADEMLRKIRPQDAEPQVASTEFSAFLKSAGSAATNLSQEQREALFREFMQWREKQQRNTQR
jgi:hypothetical protein